MYCPHCGDEISEHAEICPKCGMRVTGGSTSTSGEDKPNIPLNILSFCCIPILGVILYFVWKDDKPIAAKSVLIWSLVSIGISVLLSIIFFALGMLGALIDSTTYY